MDNPNPDRFSHVGRWRESIAQGGWWHSFQLPDGSAIEGVNSIESLRRRIGNFPIPADLTGLRALDIGTWDGWFAFELERRGAAVLAVDLFDNPRFREIHSLLRSQVDYRQIDLFDLTPQNVGQFDIVLFMGVLYHLKHPLLGLERVCALTRGLAAVDSFVLQEAFADGLALDRPVMEFFETDAFGGQTDNWNAPSLACLLAFCRTAGFARVELQAVGEYGASVACFRHWAGASEHAPSAAPQLLYARHHANFGLNFESRKDEYVTSGFRSEQDALSIADLRPTVADFGVIPIAVKPAIPGEWTATFKLPPGLGSGWHDVRVRIRDSAPSNPLRIAVDVPLPADRIAITGVRDARTGAVDQYSRRPDGNISVWISGAPENTDLHNLRPFIAGRRAPITYLDTSESADMRYGPGAFRQLNLLVPSGIPAGKCVLVLQLGESQVEREIEILE